MQKHHSEIVPGDRIMEGTGRQKRTIRVNSLERFPESLCRGTHVPGDPIEGVPVTYCYTEYVNVK